jgi:hypothetical protein
MNTQSLKEAIRRELPEFLRTDPDLRAYILDLTRREYAGRAQTQDRFYELLAELRRDREESARKWEVALDVIIQNGLLLICELKSSIDKAGMYIFERKARFYEQRHQRTANRLIVISPMIDPRARKVAERLGIETYGDSLDVQSL